MEMDRKNKEEGKENIMSVTDETIARINELYRKSKNEGLTNEEAMEQAQLRKEYVQAMHNNLRGILDNVQVQNPDGSIEKLKSKKKETEKKGTFKKYPIINFRLLDSLLLVQNHLGVFPFLRLLHNE